MKILIIGTPTSGAKKLMNGISEQGYEFLDEPFLQTDWLDSHKNFMDWYKDSDYNKFVVKITTRQKPKMIKDYFLFISQFTSQFDKLILLDRININIKKNKKFNGFNIKTHKNCIQKISEIMNTPIISSEKIFTDDAMEQFEVINKMGLDLDSFELQSFLQPSNTNQELI